MAQLLQARPAAAVTICYQPSRAPYRDTGAFDKDVAAIIAALAAEGRCRAELTPYGLRHWFGVTLALAGASDAHIMAAMGHTTTAQAVGYRRQAERLALADAAMDLLEDNIVPLSRRTAKD